MERSSQMVLALPCGAQTSGNRGSRLERQAFHVFAHHNNPRLHAHNPASVASILNTASIPMQDARSKNGGPFYTCRFPLLALKADRECHSSKGTPVAR